MAVSSDSSGNSDEDAASDSSMPKLTPSKDLGTYGTTQTFKYLDDTNTRRKDWTGEPATASSGNPVIMMAKSGPKGVSRRRPDARFGPAPFPGQVQHGLSAE